MTAPTAPAPSPTARRSAAAWRTVLASTQGTSPHARRQATRRDARRAAVEASLAGY